MCRPTTRMYTGRKASSGQALTEFLVVAVFVLIPLFLIVPVLAKVISLDQDVEMAARYAAWERTVWYESKPEGLSGYDGQALKYKSDAEIAAEVDARIFAEATQPIVSATDVAYELDPFARHQNGEGQPLIETATRNNNSAGDEYAAVTSGNRHAGGLAGLMGGLAKVGDTIGPFDVPREGLYETRASIGLVDLSDVFGANLGVVSLALESENALFTESWNAGGRAHAEYRIEGLLPQQYLNNSLIGTLQSVASLLPFVQAIDPDCLIFGYTTIEPVPVHRLQDIGSSIEGSEGTSCPY